MTFSSISSGVTHFTTIISNQNKLQNKKFEKKILVNLMKLLFNPK